MTDKEQIELAFKALTLLKDWSVWLVGIQTAAIGFLGAYYRSGIARKNIRLLKICTIGFVLSIVFAALSLGGIPSVASQLIAEGKLVENVFAMSFQKWVPIKLFWLTYIELLCFFVGVSAFAKLIYLETTNPKQSNKENSSDRLSGG